MNEHSLSVLMKLIQII